MCGIAGAWSPRIRKDGELGDMAKRMAAALAHRGPDGEGTWTDAESGIALGHRRLAVVDLSEAGRQPMVSEEGRYVISFNGEIYNFPELRAALDGTNPPPAWRGRSDTEVLLAAIVRWGLAAALERAVGMFALVLWDREERVLALARDRFGEKPLYYGAHHGGLLFASELKAFRAVPGWRGEIDRRSVGFLMHLSAIPAPSTIYRDTYMLEPGTLLEIREGDLGGRAFPAPAPYWSLASAIERAKADPFPGDERAAAEELERRIGDSIAKQMVADVPVGAFLSGGIDSSCIVALMQQRSDRPIRTFTIGFNEAEYDEAEHAAAIARHLGTDHTDLYVSPEETRAVIPELAGIFDEPFADASQIPTILVSRMARSHVTVSLSGDAGDELFGGYNRYRWSRGIANTFGRMPGALAGAVAGTISSIPPAVWDRGSALLSPLSGGGRAAAALGDKAHKYAALITARDAADLYDRMVAQWDPAALLAEGGARHAPRHAPAAAGSIEERMMYWDATRFLPDDILVKVDRSAMSVALETRIPLLDPGVVEFAWRLPLALKIRGGVGKRILRAVAFRHVPRELLERPKMGFRVPIDHWLRGPLFEWADALLDEKRIGREGYLDPAPVAKAWREHLSGRRNWQYRLWAVLMFESWLECYH